jgi:hypothetical protein
VIAGEAFPMPQLVLTAVTVLAPVIVASEKERIGDLTAEAAGNVNEFHQPDDHRSR